MLIHDINTNKMSQKAEISKKINSKRQSSVPIPAISEEKLSSSSNSFNSKNGENFLDEDNLKNEGRRIYKFLNQLPIKKECMNQILLKF